MRKMKLAVYLMAGIVVLASCSDDAEDNGNIEQELTQTEVQSILETDDVTSVVDEILADLYIANDGSTSRSATENDDCYSAEYGENGFTAVFNNCALNGTDNINGTLTVTYGLDDSSATYTAAYEDFFVGTIKINGTRTYVLSGSEEESSLSFTITSNITVEFEDGETISENGVKTFAVVFQEMEDTLWNLSGNWTVQVDGTTYSISGDVSRNFVCEYWTMGSMTVNKNGLEVDIDFGEGSCDDDATLTYPDGTTQDIKL